MKAMATVSLNGSTDPNRKWEYTDLVIGQGGMKDVYMSPDRSYVVGFFRTKPDPAGQERLQSIVGRYNQGIFQATNADYWRSRFCWPVDVVQHQGRVGVVAPTYPKNFFFEHGSVNNDALGIRGNEKEGKWFASAKVRRFLKEEEKGTWKDYLKISLNISRAVRRMHAAGLAHSDLSYKNVLVDPVTGQACLIDIDGLVVPGKFPPDVVGTPDFIAPEVLSTMKLGLQDPNRKLPSQSTDLHALAVLIYMYLFYRHPLRGGRILDQDPSRDDELSMGAKALFIEHPTDFSNRVKPTHLSKYEEFWGDPSKISYKIAGPLLADLFHRAFVDGLHDPGKRPIAAEWETALIKTMDLLQPCSNSSCEMKWYVFDNTKSPSCPRCANPFSGKLPILNLYSSRKANEFRADNHRLMVWDGQSLFQWHANRTIVPNENLSQSQMKRVGYFQMHGGEWYLINEALPAMKDVTGGSLVPVGGKVALTEGRQILLSPEEGGRLIQVQLAGA
jgi:serine/threonine protein kinase